MSFNYTRGNWPSGIAVPGSRHGDGVPVVHARIFERAGLADARRMKAERRSCGLARHRTVCILGVGCAVQKLEKVGQAWKTLCVDGRWRARAPLVAETGEDG